LSRLAPHIARIERDKDRNVADDLDPAAVGMFPELGPLRIEKKLIKLVFLDRPAQLLSCDNQRSLVACLEFHRPLVPRPATLCFANRHKQAVLVEPDTFSL